MQFSRLSGIRYPSGDIITHPYHGGTDTILDTKGKVKQEYWEAKKRGIEVDLGLDRFHGDLQVMKSAMEQGFLPDYISTDQSMVNIDSICFDLPTTVSKVLWAGMSLTEALARCTVSPAAKMGKQDDIGSMKVGASADIALFELDTGGGHEFTDFFGNTVTAEQRLIPCMTIRRGKILKPVSRSTETLDCLRRGNPWTRE